MAKNFEIIINYDAPVLRADGSVSRLTIDDAVRILDTKNCKYIYAPHPCDEMSNFNHFHLGIHTDSDNTYETIAKWFNLPVNAVQRIKSRFDSTYALYLIHYNQEGKTQIDPSNVTANFPIDYDKLITNVKNAVKLDDIFNGIADGKIHKYNMHEFIDVITYARNQSKIEHAFDYRIRKIKGDDRDMECIFITGKSGAGKTTYAKMTAEQCGMKYYVSSGSNDVLDDYGGEPCIILDDLRPSCFNLSDLLKLLDNNTASSVKSRFRNKVLECQLIIITTTLPIDRFFNEVFSNEPETPVQLMRRCGTYLKMDDEFIAIWRYDRAIRDYKFLTTIPNPVPLQFKFKEMTEAEQYDETARILGMTGDALKALSDAVKHGDFTPLPNTEGDEF